MNGKTAKKLRKIAFGMVLAAEQAGKSINKVMYVTNNRGSIVVAPNTWKGLYKDLKKASRKDRQGKSTQEATPRSYLVKKLLGSI